MSLHIFGIRHHGPGSSRSLQQALEALKHDCVLIEGPPDADGILSFVSSDQMRPPVAILVYTTLTRHLKPCITRLQPLVQNGLP